MPLEDLAELVVKDKNDIYTKYLKVSEIQFFKDFLDSPEKLESALKHLGIFNKSIEVLYWAALENV